MRIAAAVVLIIAVGLALADLGAPSSTAVVPGSVGVEPMTDLERLPAEPDCDDLSEEDHCWPNYAFAPGVSIVAWVSVRNEGPAPVILDGVVAEWFDRPELMLYRPVRVIDGGDPIDPAGWQPTQTAWQPVSLSPNEQRMVGIEFRTSADLAAMCRHYSGGGGVGFGHAPLQWGVALATHVHELPLPFYVMAPTTTQCAEGRA
jgi:hypothetical protein